MNRVLRIAGTILLLACWTGSVNATRVTAQPPPPGGTEIAHAIAVYTPAEASASHMMRPLNDTNTILYEQSFGGGGVGLGVLLGPLGVAANIAAIKGRTEKEAALLHDKLGIDPQELLKQALAASELRVASAGEAQAATIKPVLDVVSMGDHDLRFAVTLKVDRRPSGKEWTGSYVWQLRTTYTREAVAGGLSDADRQALEQEASGAFKELVAIYVQDAKEALPNGAPVRFHCTFLAPRFKLTYNGVNIGGPEGRLTVRLPNMVVSLPDDAVERVK